MTGNVETFRRNYAPAFLRYLSQRSEPALRSGYELGRSAVRDGLSLLDLVQIHHRILVEVLKTSTDARNLEEIAEAGSAFLVEVLATYEMTQRSFRETHAGGQGS